MVENWPFLMLVVEGTVMVVALNAPCMTPMTINPFMLVMLALMTTEVSPDSGDDIFMTGAV